MARARVERDDMTVDLIVWRHFGRQDDRLVERTFEINPGLAAMGDFLPVGTEFNLPEPPALAPPQIETVRLF